MDDGSLEHRRSFRTVIGGRTAGVRPARISDVRALEDRAATAGKITAEKRERRTGEYRLFDRALVIAATSTNTSVPLFKAALKTQIELLVLNELGNTRPRLGSSGPLQPSSAILGH